MDLLVGDAYQRCSFIFFLTEIKFRTSMASPENRKIFVVNTRDRCIFRCCLGSGMAVALSPSAAQED
jgi:hypothetical protein